MSTKQIWRCALIAIAAILIQRIGAQSLPPLPPPPSTNDPESWEGEIQQIIEDEARMRGVIPGRFAGFYAFEVCINNEVNFLRFTISGGEDNNILMTFNPPPDPQGRDCSKSTDLQGLDNDNEDTMRSILNALNGMPYNTPLARPSQARQASGGSTLPNLLPALADVPFDPTYPASAYTDNSNCDPSMSPDVLMVNHSSATVTRYTSCRGPTVAVIPVAPNPLQVALTQDGSLAVVTSYDNAINFIDTSTNMATQLSTPSFYPSGVAISPDDSSAYVTSYIDSTGPPALIRVDLITRQVAKTLQLPYQYPQSVGLTPDGAQAYVLFPFQGVLIIVDTLTMTVARTMYLPGPAYGVAFNSTGTQAYLGCRTEPGTIQVIDTATYQIVKSIQVGDNPTDLFILDDRVLLTNNFYGQSISVIDLGSLTVIQTLSAPGMPSGMVQTQ